MVEAENRFKLIQEDTKWQYRREKLPKPAATRDAATFGSLQHPGWSSARTAENSISLTAFARTAVTMTAKRSSKRKKRKIAYAVEVARQMRPYAFFRDFSPRLHLYLL